MSLLDSRRQGRDLTLNRPDRKNPLTFESYARDCATFSALSPMTMRSRRWFITGAGGNFCSGGDVYEIIGPLVEMDMPGLLAFTRMTGDLVKAMRACPQPIVAAIDGVCAGAGAILAMASDLRLGTRAGQGCFPVYPRRPCRLRHGRLRDPAAHHRPGPRRRAALHRPLHGRRGSERWGFFNRLVEPERARRGADSSRASSPHGPTFAHAHDQDACSTMEWAMGSTQAIEAEAQAQAICMQTEDFARAYQPSSRKEAGVRGELNARSQASSPGRSSTRPSRLADELRPPGPRKRPRRRDLDDVDAACRALVAALGKPAG